MPATRATYCSTTGLSRPSWPRRRSMSAWLAVAPAINVASSPGTALKMKKMMVSKPSAIAGTASSRESVKPSISSDGDRGAPRNGEHDGPELDALDALPHGGGVLVHVQPYIRGVVPHDLLHLGHDVGLLGRVRGNVRLREQLIHLRIAVAAEVPDRRPAGIVDSRLEQRLEVVEARSVRRVEAEHRDIEGERRAFLADLVPVGAALDLVDRD